MAHVMRQWNVSFKKFSIISIDKVIVVKVDPVYHNLYKDIYIRIRLLCNAYTSKCKPPVVRLQQLKAIPQHLLAACLNFFRLTTPE